MVVDDGSVTVEGLQEGTMYEISVATEGRDGIRGEVKTIQAMTVIDRLQSHEVSSYVREYSVAVCISKELENKLHITHRF